MNNIIKHLILSTESKRVQQDIIIIILESLSEDNLLTYLDFYHDKCINSVNTIVDKMKNLDNYIDMNELIELYDEDIFCLKDKYFMYTKDFNILESSSSLTDIISNCLFIEEDYNKQLIQDMYLDFDSSIFFEIDVYASDLYKSFLYAAKYNKTVSKALKEAFNKLSSDYKLIAYKLYTVYIKTNINKPDCIIDFDTYIESLYLYEDLTQYEYLNYIYALLKNLDFSKCK